MVRMATIITAAARSAAVHGTPQPSHSACHCPWALVPLHTAGRTHHAPCWPLSSVQGQLHADGKESWDALGGASGAVKLQQVGPAAAQETEGNGMYCLRRHLHHVLSKAQQQHWGPACH